LYLAAAETSRVRRGSQGYTPLKPEAFHDGKSFQGYECPLNAPPYVDRVWRQLITYGAQYRIFCTIAAQGIMFRRDPRQNPQAALDRYNLARNQLYAQ